jgi:aryl-alcohol dehydrogenase-like predicted oxidoreductase
VTAWQLSTFLHTSEKHHWSRFISLQLLYNALNRSVESEQLPLCEAEGLGVMAYNPLAGGLLTGKYRRGEPLPQGVRLQYWPVYYDRYYTERSMDVVEGLVAAAQARGANAAQLALAWILAEPRVTCPIVGARNVEQLDDTLGGLEIKLSREEREAIPAVRAGHWEGVDQVYDRKY